MLFRSFALLLKLVVWLLLFICRNSVIYSGSQPLSGIWFEIFSVILWVAFSLFDSVLSYTVFAFDEVTLFFFVAVVVCFLVSYPNHCQIQCHEPFPLCLLRFYSLTLHSDSLSLLELQFHIWPKERDQLHSCKWISSFSLVRDCPFPPLNGPVTRLLKITWLYHVRFYF